MDLKDAMATNLRRIRQLQGVSQEELAERANLSARYIGSIERAKVSASVTVLGKISDALELDPAELLAKPPSRRSR